MAQDASEEVSSIGRWNFFYCKLRALNAVYRQVKPEKSAILMIPKGRIWDSTESGIRLRVSR